METPQPDLIHATGCKQPSLSSLSYHAVLSTFASDSGCYYLCCRDAALTLVHLETTDGAQPDLKIAPGRIDIGVAQVISIVIRMIKLKG
jgi:hypothetical protein